MIKKQGYFINDKDTGIFYFSDIIFYFSDISQRTVIFH